MFEYRQAKLSRSTNQQDTPNLAPTQHSISNSQPFTEQQVCCTVCFDYVSSKVAEKHLQVCAGFDGLKDLPDALDKLNKKLLNFKDSYAIAAASELLTQILSNKSEEVADALHSENLLSIFPYHSGNLKHLLSIKVEVLASRKPLGLSRMKKKLEMFRCKQRTSQKLLFREKPGLNLCIGKIEDITSQVASKCGTSVKPTTSSVFDSFQIEDFSAFEDEKDIPEDTDEGSLESQFYSLCLSTKMGFSSTHPAQTVSISGLYVKAIHRDLSAAAWPEFIHNELSNPANWVRRVRGPRRTVKSRLALVIEEIKER